MISVDWSGASPWLITIPQSDTTLRSGTIYEITVDRLWELLRDFSDEPQTMPYPKLYRRIPATSATPAITDVDEKYYTCQFEDGLYSVEIMNGDSNFRVVEVKNQVSVGTNNTAGFINPVFLESGLFGGVVTVDAVNGYSGTGYTQSGGVIGTPQYPSNTIGDAKIIGASRGLDRFDIKGDIEITATDVVDDLTLIGQGATFTHYNTFILMVEGCSTVNTKIETAFIEGYQNGEMEFVKCVIGEIFNSHCKYEDCSMVGPLHKVNSAWTVNHTSDYHKCRTSVNWLETDCDGSPLTQVFSDYIGRIKVTNFTHADGVIMIELSSGQAWIDASCTASNIFIFGQGSLQNDSAIEINTDGLVDPADLTASNIAGSVWQYERP
jgi:hypothetical protein